MGHIHHTSALTSCSPVQWTSHSISVERCHLQLHREHHDAHILFAPWKNVPSVHSLCMVWMTGRLTGKYTNWCTGCNLCIISDTAYRYVLLMGKYSTDTQNKSVLVQVDIILSHSVWTTPVFSSNTWKCDCVIPFPGNVIHFSENQHHIVQVCSSHCYLNIKIISCCFVKTWFYIKWKQVKNRRKLFVS